MYYRIPYTRLYAMLSSNLVCYAILCTYAVLCYAMLYYAILYCISLYYTTLYYTTRVYYAILYYATTKNVQNLAIASDTAFASRFYPATSWHPTECRHGWRLLLTAASLLLKGSTMLRSCSPQPFLSQRRTGVQNSGISSLWFRGSAFKAEGSTQPCCAESWVERAWPRSALRTLTAAQEGLMRRKGSWVASKPLFRSWEASLLYDTEHLCKSNVNFLCKLY